MPSRRTAIAALSALFAAPALAACGSRGTEPGGSGGTTAPGVEDAFPVTIPHKYGETTITAAPQRVVCVGLTDQDAMLALGVVPVGVTDWYQDGTPGCIYPWATSLLNGAAVPEVLQQTAGVEAEKIAALAPDLIIGQYAGITEKDFQLLTKIAPTVVQPGEHVDYGVPWQESTRTIGTALGKLPEAEKLITDTTAAIAQVAEANKAVFAKSTAAVLTAWEGIYVYGPQDPRWRIVEALGFTFAPTLENPKATEFGWSISPERAGDLADIDAVVWLASPDQVKQSVGAVWEQTKTAKQGRAIMIHESVPLYPTAFSFVTPLSIPYVLERLVPQLVAALDGDPGTKVIDPKA